MEAYFSLSKQGRPIIPTGGLPTARFTSEQVLSHQLYLRVRLRSYRYWINVGTLYPPTLSTAALASPSFCSDHCIGFLWVTTSEVIHGQPTPQPLVQTPSLWAEPKVMTHEHGCHVCTVCLHLLTLPAPTRWIEYFQLRMCSLVRVSKWMSEK